MVYTKGSSIKKQFNPEFMKRAKKIPHNQQPESTPLIIAHLTIVVEIRVNCIPLHAA